MCEKIQNPLDVPDGNVFKKITRPVSERLVFVNGGFTPPSGTTRHVYCLRTVSVMTSAHRVFEQVKKKYNANAWSDPSKRSIRTRSAYPSGTRVQSDRVGKAARVFSRPRARNNLLACRRPRASRFRRREISDRERPVRHNSIKTDSFGKRTRHAVVPPAAFRSAASVSVRFRPSSSPRGRRVRRYLWPRANGFGPDRSERRRARRTCPQKGRTTPSSRALGPCFTRSRSTFRRAF